MDRRQVLGALDRFFGRVLSHVLDLMDDWLGKPSVSSHRAARHFHIDACGCALLCDDASS